MTGSLWEHAGADIWSATDFSRGPWHPDFCHGGPVTALLTRAVEQFDEGPWVLAQHHIELTRPVPVDRPLRLDTALDRPGRKVSVVAVQLSDGDVTVARSRAVRIRRAVLPLPGPLPDPSEPLASPDSSPATHLESEAVTGTAFHSHSVDFRIAEGAMTEPGPLSAWIGLRVTIVPHEEPTGTQRLTAVSDFPNGISGALDPERYSFINPDLSLNMVREPRGHWMGLRAATHYGDAAAGTGVAMAEAELHDLDGRVGRATQSLLIDPVRAIPGNLAGT
jgi:hypothetical protein